MVKPTLVLGITPALKYIYIYIYIIGLHFDEGIASIGDVMNFYNEFLLSCFVFEIEVWVYSPSCVYEMFVLGWE